MTRDDLAKIRPSVDSVTIRLVRGDITKREYDRQIVVERREESRPPAEQTGPPKR